MNIERKFRVWGYVKYEKNRALTSVEGINFILVESIHITTNIFIYRRSK